MADSLSPAASRDWYEILPAEDLCDPEVAGRVGAEASRSAPVLPAGVLTVPPVLFGDRAERPHWKAQPEGAWEGGVEQVPERRIVILRDAVVHPPHGVVSVGRSVLRESLVHVPIEDAGYRMGAAGSAALLQLPRPVAEDGLDQAQHAIAPTLNNYYHWLLDGVARLQVPPFAAHDEAGAVLLPRSALRAQEDLLRVLSAQGRRAVVQGDRAIRVGRLAYLPTVTGYGFHPSPDLAAFFDRLLAALDIARAPRRRLYVGRADAAKRPLENEAEIAALAARRGYEVVTLAGMGLAAQARLFAEASHVVAPHGAGLANLVFAAPGLRLCELHTDIYVNWCFRRLATLRRTEYGCVVGAARSVPTGDWPHDTGWTVAPDAVAAALDAMDSTDGEAVPDTGGSPDGPAAAGARRDLRLECGAGQAVRPRIRGRLHRFDLAPGCGERQAWVVSALFVPGAWDPASPDRRRLGIAVERLLVDGQPVALESLAETDGWHALERGHGVAWRWTNGRARLPLPAAARTLELEVTEWCP